MMYNHISAVYLILSEQEIFEISLSASVLEMCSSFGLHTVLSQTVTGGTDLHTRVNQTTYMALCLVYTRIDLGPGLEKHSS